MSRALKKRFWRGSRSTCRRAEDVHAKGRAFTGLAMKLAPCLLFAASYAGAMCPVSCTAAWGRSSPRCSTRTRPAIKAPNHQQQCWPAREP